MRLEKYKNNPILTPNENDWENLSVCNPGAWYEDGTFYMLYRAAGNDKDYVIHFGLATSTDGFNFTRVSDKPVMSPRDTNFDEGCIEDPRIVKFHDEYYITYAFRPFPPGQYWLPTEPTEKRYPVAPEAPLVLKNNIATSALAMTKDFRHFKRLGRITDSRLDDRDVILFPEKINGKFVMLHRPKEWVGEKYGCDDPAIWITYSDDLMEWDEESRLLAKGAFDWEAKIGGSTPPLRTDKGWLMLYHAVGDDKTYRVGAMLLDLENPEKILARTKTPILEPEYDFEKIGIYSKGGGCVFPTGNCIVNDTLYVYYGAADKNIGVATCNINELLDFLVNENSCVNE